MPGNLFVESTQQDVGIDTFTRAAPLPRLAPLPPKPSTSGPERYEVVVVGAGPSGLMMTTLLTRLGLPSTSLICIDSRPHQTLAGNADGVNGRTLEILGQLGLESRILKEGTPFAESTLWMRDPGNPDILARVMCNLFILAPARYEQVVTLHQGRIESLFREDVGRYGGDDVHYDSKLVGMRIDEDGDKEFPVLATIEMNGARKEVRTKYLVGADGAKSAVRDFMCVETEGDQTEELWAVIDLVANSDFPDLRRQSNINTSTAQEGLWGAVSGGFVIPRERLSNGDYLTRLYLDMTVKGPTEKQKQTTKERRSQITKELILEHAARLFYPFRFEIKKGTQVAWWAAFQISQRLAKSFTVNDSSSHPRVFIVGDACHSHSPRQGQGMNVSIQDSHNLAWKLAYTVLGLNSSKTGLLESYQEERLPNAKELIAFDGRMNQEGRSPAEKFADMKHFATSCGIEYGEGSCVSRKEFDKIFSEGKKIWTSDDYLNGIIIPGRRLSNCKIKRFADSNWRDIHDELRGDGRFSVLMLGSDDFGQANGKSTSVAANICNRIISSENSIFPPGLIRPIIIFPHLSPAFEWTDLPGYVKEEAEMNLFQGTEAVYSLYGVQQSRGGLVVIRPDGVVGMVADMEDIQSIIEYLGRILALVEE